MQNPNLTPVHTPGTLTFGVGTSGSSSTTDNCTRVENGTTSTSPLSGDLRIEDMTEKFLGGNPVLDRPSTSWDAQYSANVVMKSGTVCP